MLSGPFFKLFNKAFIILFTFVILIISESLAVIYIKHNNRILYSSLQNINLEKVSLHEKWSALLLEKSIWVNENRIEKIARDELYFAIPDKIKIISYSSLENDVRVNNVY